MKRIISFLLSSAVLLFSSCKKESGTLQVVQNSQTYVDSAIGFLKTELSANDLAILDFSSFKILMYNNTIIGIQIFEKNNQYDKFILLKKDSQKFTGNWVDMSGLNSNSSKYRSGAIILESLNRQGVTKLIVDSNEVTQINKSGVNIPASVKIIPRSNSLHTMDNQSLVSARTEVQSPVLPEVVVVCNKCRPAYDYSSLYWLYDGDASYGAYYVAGGGSGGGGSGTATGTVGSQGNTVASLPTFRSPDEPITDLKLEFKCFTKDDKATYTVSVNINQPEPNTRNVFNLLSHFPVGHTFTTLKQHNSDGTEIIRSVGFYPANYAKPGREAVASTFGDDSNTPFTVSLEFKVSNDEFSKVLNTLTNQQGYQYDADNFNCTNSSMDALKTIEINLPDTQATDILFTGNNPADLGQDIRLMNLDDFSAVNNNRAVTRTVSPSNDQIPPLKKGKC